MEETLQPPTVATRGALIPTWIRAGVTIAERTTTAAFGAAQDVRDEAKSSVGATVDYADKLVQSGVRLARKLVDRATSLTSDAIGNGEVAVLVTVDFANRTAGGLIGASASDRATVQAA